MAEGLARYLLEKAGRSDVRVMSAGTAAAVGLPPTGETIEVMKAVGIDVSKHRGKQVDTTLIEHADAVFCMEAGHREMILLAVPEAESKVHLLRTYGKSGSNGSPDVPDPIGRPKEVYEACLLMIRDGVERIVQQVMKS